MISVKILSPIPIGIKTGEKSPVNVDIAKFEVVEEQMAERYEGQYDVTPTVDGITLETANKVMKDDVHVLSIPRYNVSNLYGGETVYIASEV